MSAAVCLVLAAAIALPAASSAAEPYGLKTFSSHTTTVGGAPYTLAGGHPDQNLTEFSLTPDDSGFEHPVENPNGTYVTLPPGFIGNPAAALRCPMAKIQIKIGGGDGSDCSPDSRVGIAVVTFDAGGVGASTATVAIYNLPPENGYPAQFGFKLSEAKGGTPTVLSVFPRPRTDSYGLTIGTPNIPRVLLSAFSATFCGNGVEGEGTGPGKPSEIPDGIRCKPSSGIGQIPFLSNPLDCSETEPRWSIAIDSVEHAGALRELGVPDLSDFDWKTSSFTDLPVTGCDEPSLVAQFDPGIAVKPLQKAATTETDQPTGLRVALEFPQSNDPTDVPNTEFDPSVPQAPPPKDITVKLPAGLAISPSSADGLGACSDQVPDDQVHYDNTKPVSCPDAAKIGSAKAFSPLLAMRQPKKDEEIIGAEPIPGDVYLLKPHPGDLVNGQDGKFRLMIELENPRYGVNFKLPGIATADKETGQITTVFTENPQLPAKELTVNLLSGPRAPLMAPVTCGKFTTSAHFVPWSSPGTPNADKETSFDVSSGPNGSDCVATPGQRHFTPALVAAGTENDRAGASSPFTLKLTRPDGDQELSSLNVTTPPGFTAKLKGIPACSEAAIAAAKGKSGVEEQATPSCPATSQVGTTTTGAGPGPNPYYTPGKAYLAGPYKGAPLSFAFITPAVAGPFDLGNVVIRAGAYLDPATAQVTVKTDELPQILDGVPLRLRSITTRLDRADFTLNPTDCEPMQVSAQVNGSNGASANPTAYFQVGGCKGLGFKPKLKLALKGKVSRRAHPSLRAHLSARPGDANIAFAQVKLPKAAFLDNAHISGICSRVQFAADQCPKGSIYGYASATTPLLDYTLTGNVYLRANPAHKLPDLVVGFNGPSSQPIEIELAGKTDSVNGALRNTFEAVPDVPVTDFRLTLFGGRKGLIEMSAGFCKSPRATYKLTGQNGKTYNTKPKVAAKCGKKTGKKGGKGKGKKKASSSRSLFSAW